MADTDPITLRPVNEGDLALIEEIMETPAGGEFIWGGFPTPGRERKRWAEDGLLTDDRGVLMVARGEERLGFASWWRKKVDRESWHWEVGLGLAPGARGQGIGVTAVRLHADYLFAHSPAHRIVAETELGNTAAQRVLDKAGFTREGVVREVVWRDGAWRSAVVYGLLRTDPRN